jgi:thioredoxin
MEPKVVELTEKTFDELVKQGEGFAVVKFYANWCPHCRAFRPTYEAVASSYGTRPVKFFKMDVDECKMLASSLAVMSIPTVAVFRNGEEVTVSRHIGGMSEKELTEWLDKYTA